MFSAIHPIATEKRTRRDVRFGPQADIGPLFDHFVGECEQLVTDYQTKRLGRLEVDHQLKFCRLQNR